MSKITPAESVKAREVLGVSQSSVARELKINRSYFSQWENNKRVLEDHLLNAIEQYYQDAGWGDDPEPDKNDDGNKDTVTRCASGMRIVDGFAIPSGVTCDVEALADEYYRNGVEIEKQRRKEITRSWVFGFDDDVAMKESQHMLALMARQYQIKQILHGQYEASSVGVDPGKTDTIKTVGDYVEAMMMSMVKPDQAGETDPATDDTEAD